MSVADNVYENLEGILKYCSDNPSELKRLQDIDYSKEMFGLNFAFFIDVNDIDKSNDKSNSKKESKRYKQDLHEVNNITVMVTNDWYERNIPFFKKYLSDKGIEPIVPISESGVTKNPAGKQSTSRKNSRYKAKAIGDAQNSVIRYILSNLGNESFNKKDLEETKKYFDNKCAYCGSSDALEIDHAVPINKTNMGEHRLGNMIPSCKSCNNKKADKDYEEFLKDKDYAIEKIEKIKAYMDSRKYVPIENNEQLKIILNTAHQEISDVAKRYIKLINDLFINNKDEPA